MVKKQFFYLLLAIGIVHGLTTQAAKGQTMELLGGNTLNGAVNGVVLGGATMALQNSNNFDPVRVGLGAGTLYGIGAGIYDISQIDKGQQLYISGTFNDGTNSSILVLLDTFYGAAGGALIASSVSLIIKAPLGKAIQYGAGTGAWTGFGFGLIDAFTLAEGPTFSPQTTASTTASKVGGLLTYSNSRNSIEIGIINAGIISQKQISRSSLTTSYKPTVNLVELNFDL